MLHLVPVIAFASLVSASAPASSDSIAHAAPAAVSMFDLFPKLRNPFRSRKKVATDTATKAPKAAKPPKVAKPKKSKKPSKAVPMELVDRRLRDLVGQQEAWYAKEGRYSRDAYRAGLHRNGDSTAFSEVQVEILYASKRGWTALASHHAAPGKSCVVYVGFRERLPVLPRTHESARDAMIEGIPACDDR
jgi:hypothetical protein